MAKKDTTTTWQQYQDGIAYKSSINLYNTVDENQRFYDGDQWYGIKAPNMPKPVFNFIEPSARFATVQVKDHKITGKYVTDGERPEVSAILGQNFEDMVAFPIASLSLSSEYSFRASRCRLSIIGLRSFPKYSYMTVIIFAIPAFLLILKLPQYLC